jgi:hypothetical protein
LAQFAHGRAAIYFLALDGNPGHNSHTEATTLEPKKLRPEIIQRVEAMDDEGGWQAFANYTIIGPFHNKIRAAAEVFGRISRSRMSGLGWSGRRSKKPITTSGAPRRINGIWVDQRRPWAQAE